MCHASAVAPCQFGVSIFDDNGALAQWVVYREVHIDLETHFEICFPWPLYVPENYIVYKSTNVAPAAACVGLTGWVGKIPDPGKYYTRY